MMGVSCFAPPVHAQFNTVMAVPVRYKVAIASLEESEEGLLPGTVSARDTPTGGTVVLPVDARKKEWVDRYLSVSYPLQRIKINSSYGYRKDLFSGKRKFHDGIDLHARGDQGAVHDGGCGREGRAGQGIRQVCHPAARQLHGRLLPPLEGTRRQRGGSPSARRGRNYRLDGAQHGRTPAHHLQAQWKKYRPTVGTGLHQIHTGGMRGGIGGAMIFSFG